MEEYFRRLHVEAQEREFQQQQELQLIRVQVEAQEREFQKQQELQRYYDYLQVKAAKDREWDCGLYLYHQYDLENYYRRCSKIKEDYYRHILRLEIFATNLEYLTRTAKIHDIPFSLFSYNIHDKDAFEDIISRSEGPKDEEEESETESESGSDKKEPNNDEESYG